MLTKLGSYLVLKRIWNLLIFKVKDQGHRRKGKLFDIDVNDCTTQDSSDDSSDFSCLSRNHEQKRDLKRKKLKRILFSVRVISRLKNTPFLNQHNQLSIFILRELIISSSQ
jgi:hypothetical protein